MERKLEPQFCIHFPESRNQLSTWRGLGHVLCSGMVWSNCWLLEFGQNQQVLVNEEPALNPNPHCLGQRQYSISRADPNNQRRYHCSYATEATIHNPWTRPRYNVL
ncbi:uncharacterized protein LOC143037903 isoform X4 [Oratosquilla oratoria]|uniref:uncharacterized protein LOC143037903 isoform X4 n=1 Tax=Oratosquilla oratoria TaxID=337810 RepID=UPI003F759BE2